MNRNAGFTLIELMISAALMTMILTGSYLCLSAGLSGQKLVESRSEVVQGARVAMALMTADLRAACPLAKEFDFLGMHRMVGEMEADNLDFGTFNYSPRHPREGDFCAVSYFLDKTDETSSYSLWRRRNPTFAPDPLAGGKREPILPGVRGLRFEYYDGYDWYDDWGDASGKPRAQNSLLDKPNLSGMPEAVRITLWLESSPRTVRTSSANDEAEPPLKFQTMVRLNLAGASLGGSAGSPTNAAANSAGQPQPNSTR
jgi:type II secretion system protein J